MDGLAVIMFISTRTTYPVNILIRYTLKHHNVKKSLSVLLFHIKTILELSCFMRKKKL